MQTKIYRLKLFQSSLLTARKLMWNWPPKIYLFC